VSTRVVVVGGGIVGCAVAYFAAREGLEVTLLEQKTVGYGASGRNPGFVWLHCRNPGFALEISRAGRRLYDELAADLPEPFEYRAEGGLIYFNTDSQARVFEEFVAARRADGLDMELIDGSEVRRLVGPIRPDVAGASFCSEDAQINTPTVVAALAAGARSEGAVIDEGVEVAGLEWTGDAVTGVRTGAGRVEADAVVVAAGAWSTALMRVAGYELPVGAERLQMMATSPLPRQVGPVVYGPLAAKQYRLFRDLPSWDADAFTAPYEREHGMEMLQLVAQRANGEMLLGCPMDYPDELDLRPTLAGIEMTTRAVREDFPGLADAPIERVWAGVLPYTTDMAPVIGEVAAGLYIASGHVFGNAAGPMTGRLIAQLLLGQEPEIDLGECCFDRPLELVVGKTTRW
jgi:glycine/D-amino acid oxidase-like deaminating enzyme